MRMGASTPLHTAATSGDRQAVRALLEGGADPNACDDQGCTPLHSALEHKHLQVARMLIAAGASLDTANGAGVTARDLAKAVCLWEAEG
jgi:ankyrin repeat protein